MGQGCAIPSLYPNNPSGRVMRNPETVAARWRLWGLTGLLLGGIGYLYLHRPYARPMTYRIGPVDARFHLDKGAFEAAAKEAAAQWNRATVRELVRYDPQGEVELRLEYDERQSTTDHLKALGRNLDQSLQGFREQEAQAQNLKSDLESRARQLEEERTAFQSRSEDLKNLIETARRGQRLTESDVKSLNAEQEVLKAQWEGLERRRVELGAARASFNLAVEGLNAQATSHNQEAAAFNAAGARLGQEFCGGEYVKEGARKTITVYFISSRNGLVRVLTHEFGHALGLPHLAPPEAVMHPRTTREDPELTRSDIQAIRERVEGKR